ncbi:hypothetical protein HC028_17220 [Planosporangium flavigriseum]|uniref:Uncharacterized protein n=1 Tax=Planosporangium flavigriseum TaxID=373681 RepID=A0A8J3PNA1_9ACTN|nr:hypothetical protein [Planosporangium flavigriseum]NJC66231.1 hypothetical protein [Planosporangium flavigriseum]GIG74688.1 hypothetical protein Pfl04_30920 [Planosporangium flavigriseum]
MAGFDATFTFDPKHAALLGEIFQAARRRARPMFVRWRSRVSSTDGHAYVVLDGNTFQLDIFLERLRRDLPAIAEAVPAGRSPAWRRKFANGLVDILTKYRCSYYDRYDADYVPRLRAVTRSSVWPVHSLWMGEQHQDLWARLVVTEEIISGWLLDEIPPEVVVEELHTAIELMLTRWCGKIRAPAFSDLVDKAEDAAILPGVDLLQWQYSEPSNALSGKDLLIALKDLRKGLKHKGVGQARPWLDVHFWPLGSVLERLAWELSRRP